MDASEFFTTPDAPAREPSRPKAINPETGKEQSWTRASNYAAELDSPFGLIKHNQRKLVFGLSVRHDLARMLLSGAVQEDPVKTDAVITAALATAEADASANEGTAAHAALVRSWLGQPVAEEFQPLVQSFAKALHEHGLTPKAAELKVMSLRFGAIGTFDWVFAEADGTEVIGDVKTGRLDQAKRKFAVQCAMYDDADYVVHPDGTTDPTPWNLAHTHAVLIHIDPETNGVSIYRVDLHIGRHGAALAEQVRRWHKLDPLTPYVPPLLRSDVRNSVCPAPAPVAPMSVAEAAQAVVHADAERVTQPVPDEIELQREEQAAEVVGPIEVAEPRPASVAIGQDPDGPTARFDALMAKHDKAALQGILKADHGWTDISHNRRWLARAIVALEGGATGSAVTKYAVAKDDDGPPPAKPEVPGQKTYDPAGLVVDAIRQMKTLEGIRILHDRRVTEFGDQGWTNEMAEAAKVRAAELAEQNGTNKSAALLALESIAKATGPQDLAEVWNRMTLGGTAAELWTDELQSAAEARMAEIRAKQTPVASNPWGN